MFTEYHTMTFAIKKPLFNDMRFLIIYSVFIAIFCMLNQSNTFLLQKVYIFLCEYLAIFDIITTNYISVDAIIFFILSFTAAEAVTDNLFKIGDINLMVLSCA